MELLIHVQDVEWILVDAEFALHVKDFLAFVMMFAINAIPIHVDAKSALIILYAILAINPIAEVNVSFPKTTIVPPVPW